MWKSALAAVFVASLGLPAPALAEDAPLAFGACKPCHSVARGRNGVGPSLFGIYGAHVGSVPGYKYSEVQLKASDMVIDEAFLTRYLADPKSVIPGNRMVFPGVKNPQDVAAIIAYLQTLKPSDASAAMH